MILISHRGNLLGPEIDNENAPDYINFALSHGTNVEIDVWYYKDTWYLGHDEPQHEISYEFLTNSKFWCHAKNKDAFYKLKQNKNINCFWHDKDLYTFTSHGFIWCNINVPLIRDSICVMPEKGINGDINICYGICSDYILQYSDT